MVRKPGGGTSSALQNVKWRFLSEAALNPIPAEPQSGPYADGARQRISHLERALASTHDLESQYRSFLQEVSKTDPSGASTFTNLAEWSLGANPLASADDDNIPSDPVDPPEEPRFAEEDAEVARLQQQAPPGTPSAAGGAEVRAGGDVDDEMRNSPSPVSERPLSPPPSSARTSLPSPPLAGDHMAARRAGTHRE